MSSAGVDFIINHLLKYSFSHCTSTCICSTYKHYFHLQTSIISYNFTIENGGAINNNWGELTITKSTLTENTAKINGGAINNNGELTITESTLQQNTAGYGGAINNTEGELTITESTLTENTAKINGGAINNWGELTITKSTLTENTAQKDGGAIRNSSGELTLKQETKMLEEELAIRNSSGELTITESTLTEILQKLRKKRFRSGELTITESRLTGNTTHMHGGAIHNLDEKSFKIKDCKLDNNIPNNY
ncbi:MAG: hypothetical protein J6P12_00115 [Methanobrevibacter sp.]|nr:hypothetical protein [Methanobrevibacter sp.]